MVSDYKISGISAKQIHITLKLADPSNPLIIRDIYNKRQTDRLRELNGKFLIDTLLKILINKINSEREFRT